MKLEGLALVTGASRGIGRAIALDFARSGARVVGTATSEAGAAAITDAFSQAGLPGEGAVLDVNDAQAAEALLDRIQAVHGAIAILVNNAGITRDGLAMRMKDEDWQAVLDLQARLATLLRQVGDRP